MKYHCFFEQSGTFKNEFKKLGFEAYDYDIQNEFNETDYVIDLFNEIEKAYNGENSVFDNIFGGGTDLIFAFFPCIRFTEQILLLFRGDSSIQKNYSLKKKLEMDMKCHEELHKLYLLICKLVIICLDKNIPLVIENPYGSQHYLTTHWCIKPKIIDKNRRNRGDYFIKPTQYFFINYEPSYNLIFEAQVNNIKKTIESINGRTKEGTIERSLIAPEYANNFIREFILSKEEFESLKS